MNAKHLFNLLITVPAMLFSSLVSAVELERELMTLHSIEPATTKHTMPVTKSMEEWNVSFNTDIVSPDNRLLHIAVPGMGADLLDYTVLQTSYRLYDNGNKQWVGNVYASSDESHRNQIGYVILNIVDGAAFGLIKTEQVTFEIYTSTKLGTRLARTSVYRQPIEFDLADQPSKMLPQNETHSIDDRKMQMSYPTVDGVAVVDVLVVLDTDLNANDPVFSSKITSELMNADMILSESGPNGVGVPLRFNILDFQTMDIPPQYEDITLGSDNEFAAYNHLANETSALSQQLMTLYENSGADYIALYVPFDPNLLGTQFCGKASIPTNFFEDTNEFKFAFTMHASVCNVDQYVFLHEIMHNFGSAHNRGHTGNPRFLEPYARGYDVHTGDPETDFSTMMACTDSVNITDPSDISCNRIPQLSSPEVTVDGYVIGVFTTSDPSSVWNADNVRFLTECAGYDPDAKGGPDITIPCRRYQLAHRQDGSHPVDLVPEVNITAPLQNAEIAISNNFELTATVSDDFGLEQAVWTIDDITSGTPVELATYQQTLNAGVTSISQWTQQQEFANAGVYQVSVTVTDDAGQENTDVHTLTVNGYPSVSITTPGDGDVLPSNAPALLTADVVDEYTITSVDWNIYSWPKGILIDAGTGTDAQYSYNTIPLNTPGDYTITAIVTDNFGQISSDFHTITVDEPPVIDITYPMNLETLVAADSVTLTATASDNDAVASVFWSIERYNIVLDSGFGNAGTYEFNTSVLNNSGIYEIQATVTDSTGQTAKDTHHIYVVNPTHIEVSHAVGGGSLIKGVVSNFGIFNAPNVRVRFTASRTPFSQAQAATSQVPAACEWIDPNLSPFADPTIINQYECTFDLSTFLDFQFNWDLICAGPLHGHVEFTAQLISIDDVPVNHANSADTYFYYEDTCIF